ncbi:MAG: hypothetical protein AAAB36_01075, partial [Ensifer adhaerens]
MERRDDAYRLAASGRLCESTVVVTVESLGCDKQRFFVQRTAKLAHEKSGEMLDLLAISRNVVLDTDSLKNTPKHADFLLAQGGKHLVGNSAHKNLAPYSRRPAREQGPNCPWRDRDK